MVDCFPDAARRHRSDSKHLASDGRFQNAGHLIGIAAECLVKEILERSGIIINREPDFQVHFPRLRSVVRAKGRTRSMRLLFPIASGRFLDGWHATRRYEPNLVPAVAEAEYRSWDAEVDRFFRLVGIP